MTREIKFKAWDEGAKEMLPWDLVIHSKTMPDFESSIENGLIMQYTGLKDKNGVEIYEGDIVKGVDEHKGQSEVFIGDVFELQPFSYLNDYEGNNFEVIGNIYETPNLLK